MNPNVNILIDALKNIQSYDHDGDGICPYGCDTPNIAKTALVDFGNAEYASQQAVALDAGGRCIHCGAGDSAHHSFSCPTGLHPDRRQ